MIRSVAWVVLVVAVFLATTAFRFLNLKNGFPDDHYVHLTGGWQMTFGEWPTRDFVDPGLPAMFAASAMAQSLLGDTLYSEVVLVAVAFGAAAAFTMLAVRQLTGSMILALLAAIAEVAIVPRTYGYPKLLLYAVGFWLMARYAVRPTSARAAAMAAIVVIAFLFRHDHGLFLGTGGLLVAALSTKERTVRAALRSSGIFAALVAVLLLPYVIFIEAYMGLGLYIRTGIAFSRAEAARQGHVWPSVFGDNRLQAALLYECYLIPLIALAVVAWDRRREVVAQIVPIAVAALMASFGFIREPLGTRLPDAIVPLVVLGAWLIGRAWAPGRPVQHDRPYVQQDRPYVQDRLYDVRRLVAIAVSVAAIVIVGASIVRAGHTVEELDRAALLAPWGTIPGRFGERADQYKTRFDDYLAPSGEVLRLVPFFHYLDRCTTRAHRLLNVGFAVEVPYFARRAFAGGISYFAGYPAIPELDQRVLTKMRNEVVPFVLVASEFATDFSVRFPLTERYVRVRYRPLLDVKIRDDLTMHILIDPNLPSRGRDQETGYPCFA
ncbi:MAG TPA: hypothetical protein VKA59_15630 [Vicinamibacterales bacterium]|nr:hypothetical protein [Vicinamibacterales bacterium]